MLERWFLVLVFAWVSWYEKKIGFKTQDLPLQAYQSEEKKISNEKLQRGERFLY